jgi:hypothetical protein
MPRQTLKKQRGGELVPHVFYHYSRRPIESLRNKPETNEFIEKGYGKPHGLWLSRGRKWEQMWPLDPSHYNVYEVRVKDDKLLKIKSIFDFEELLQKYKLIKNGKTKYPLEVDWSLVAKDYAGVYFENYNKRKMFNNLKTIKTTLKSKLGKRFSRYRGYRSVDITSICVFRPSEVITSWKPIVFPDKMPYVNYMNLGNND